MKLLLLIALGVMLGAALLAQENEDRCEETPTLQQLEPLTPEEQLVVDQLEAIQVDPSVQQQADEQAQVPLEAFGGC